jgi:hypothetical protein
MKNYAWCLLLYNARHLKRGLKRYGLGQVYWDLLLSLRDDLR